MSDVIQRVPSVNDVIDFMAILAHLQIQISRTVDPISFQKLSYS
jgi:hypothetical protein